MQYTLRTMTSPGPLVAVIMGSTSDWDTMAHAAQVLDRFAVPPDLVAEVAARRRGEPTPLSGADRLRRAGVARRLVAAGIDRLVPAR